MMQNEEMQKITLEEGFQKLDEITEKLEDASLSLENRFELYKEGMDLVKICTEKIDMVEKKLMIIQENGTVKEND